MRVVKTVTLNHYVAGIVGLGLIRHWYVDGEANETRLAELAELLSRGKEFPYSLELSPSERSVEAGYEEWAATYDGPNPMISLEESAVVPILRRLCEPDPGQSRVRALDAACGTGRHARLLDSLGCDTVGVDQSEAMLAVARNNVPTATFHCGDVEHLEFDDHSFDLAVISLALCHLPDPADAVTELARVLAPGGTLVITDPHPMSGILGGQAYYGGVADGRTMTYVRNHRHGAATWLRAFRAAGLDVVECIEVPFTDEQIAGDPSAAFHPDAARSALTGLPSVWVWELRRPI